jgi:hypothetical protein
MGMSDRQFDAYKQTVLGRLEIALKEIEEKGSPIELKKLMKEFEEQLKRP